MHSVNSISPSRRFVLGGASAFLAGPAYGRNEVPFSASEAAAVFERYHGFGDKASGGDGDNASGEWLIGMLEGLGYACRRQRLDVPVYTGPEPTLAVGGASAKLIPQAIVIPTGPGGVTAPLRLEGAGDGGGRGAIALIALPYARWSTAKGEVERRVEAEIARGALGVVLVTNGPTGQACALNAPAAEPLFDRPTAVLAPKDAEPFLRAAAAGEQATFTMAGRSARRAAFNVTATLSRGATRWLVISTPRSGWFGCVGERGPGLAVWLMLARWAARTPLNANVALVATSGHEYENEGGEHYIQEAAPKPDRTALWLHLGANVAARDWHERGADVSPLPSADPQRYLLGPAPLVPVLQRAFAGQPGLERPYPADARRAAGELGNILRAGYRAVGVFGAHRFHHTTGDDLRCVAPDLIPPVADAFAQVILRAIGDEASR